MGFSVSMVYEWWEITLMVIGAFGSLAVAFTLVLLFRQYLENKDNDQIRRQREYRNTILAYLYPLQTYLRNFIEVLKAAKKYEIIGVDPTILHNRILHIISNKNITVEFETILTGTNAITVHNIDTYYHSIIGSSILKADFPLSYNLLLDTHNITHYYYGILNDIFEHAYKTRKIQKDGTVQVDLHPHSSILLINTNELFSWLLSLAYSVLLDVLSSTPQELFQKREAESELSKSINPQRDNPDRYQQKLIFYASINQIPSCSGYFKLCLDIMKKMDVLKDKLIDSISATV